MEYVRFVHNKLRSCVLDNNENSNIDEFLDFKEACLFNIIRLDKNKYVKSFNGLDIKKDVPNAKRMYSSYANPIGFTEGNIINSYFTYILIVDSFEFRSKMVHIIRPGGKYAFLLKFKRDDGCWGMGRKHITFLFLGDYEEILKRLHSDLVEIVEEYIQEYRYCGLDLIQLMTISIERLPDLEIENINKIKLDKNGIRIGETKRAFNNIVLPLTMNVHYYGNKLDKQTTNNKISAVYMDNMNRIPFIIENSKLVNKMVDPSLLDFYEFISKKKRKHILVVKRIDNESNQIEVWDKNGNNIVFAEDFKLNDGGFKRVISKFTFFIKENAITRYPIQDKFPIIKP